MSNAKKCDLCGKYFEPYLIIPYRGNKCYKYLEIHNYDKHDYELNDAKTYDLCEACADSFEQWLESRKGEEC